MNTRSKLTKLKEKERQTSEPKEEIKIEIGAEESSDYTEAGVKKKKKVKVVKKVSDKDTTSPSTTADQRDLRVDGQQNNDSNDLSGRLQDLGIGNGQEMVAMYKSTVGAGSPIPLEVFTKDFVKFDDIKTLVRHLRTVNFSIIC